MKTQTHTERNPRRWCWPKRRPDKHNSKSSKTASTYSLPPQTIETTTVWPRNTFETQLQNSPRVCQVGCSFGNQANHSHQRSSVSRNTNKASDIRLTLWHMHLARQSVPDLKGLLGFNRLRYRQFDEGLDREIAQALFYMMRRPKIRTQNHRPSTKSDCPRRGPHCFWFGDLEGIPRNLCEDSQGEEFRCFY